MDLLPQVWLSFSNSASVLRQRFHQFRLDGNLGAVLLQFSAFDQKGVVHPLAECRDLGELQVDFVSGQNPCDAVQQADPVAG